MDWVSPAAASPRSPQGLRAQEAYKERGYKVTTLQPRPALVDNYRPWMEQLKESGAKADFEETRGLVPQPLQHRVGIGVDLEVERIPTEMRGLLGPVGYDTRRITHQ